MKLRFLSLLIVPALLQACGGTQVIPGQSSGNLSNYKTAHIAEVVINSDDGNEDERAVDKKMETYARSKIESVLTEKHFASVDATAAGKTPTLIIKFNGSVHHGSRAARWAAGGLSSAGKGTMSSRFEAIDSLTQKVVYSSSAESELKIGFAGGSMESVIEENIDELLEAFGER